mgnify:CR=1 FL=1
MHTFEHQPAAPSSPWIVYMVRCRDGSYYTGITTDLPRRLAEHNSPQGGAKYTRSRRPVTLAYREPALSRSSATRREGEIKKMSATAKARLLTAVPSSSGVNLCVVQSLADTGKDGVMKNPREFSPPPSE